MKTVSEAMTKQVISVQADAMAEKALLQILAGQYSGMPVIDGISRVVGIISEFDLLKAIQKKLVLNATPIEQIMTQSPITVDVKDGLKPFWIS